MGRLSILANGKPIVQWLPGEGADAERTIVDLIARVEGSFENGKSDAMDLATTYLKYMIEHGAMSFAGDALMEDSERDVVVFSILHLRMRHARKSNPEHLGKTIGDILSDFVVGIDFNSADDEGGFKYGYFVMTPEEAAQARQLWNNRH
jgi:hypothetical protein